MNRLDSLTAREKIMNMAKLGTVSQGEIFYKISGMQYLLYIMRISG